MNKSSYLQGDCRQTSYNKLLSPFFHLFKSSSQVFTAAIATQGKKSPNGTIMMYLKMSERSLRSQEAGNI